MIFVTWVDRGRGHTAMTDNRGHLLTWSDPAARRGAQKVLQAPVLVRTSTFDPQDPLAPIYDRERWLQPGEPDHAAEALSQLPQASIQQDGSVPPDPSPE